MNGNLEDTNKIPIVKPPELKSNTKAVRWNVENTTLLIERRIARDKMFSGRTLSSSAWQTVLSDLISAGDLKHLTLAQVKKKWSNVCAKYKDIKENNSNQEKNWPHFELLNNFFNKDKIETKDVIELNKDITEILLANCRLCQEMEGIYSLKKDESLCAEIDECTSLKMLEDSENLPEAICEKCKNLIKTFHKFRLQCRIVDKKLHENINHSESASKLELSDKFNCEECPMSLSTTEAYEEHMQSHKKNRRFQCDICSKNFSRLSTLCSHTKKHDNTNEKIMNEHKMEIDDLSDTNNDSYDIREVDNKSDTDDETPNKTDDKLFYCELCSKSFIRHCDLSVHINTHTGVTHMCPRQDCNKTYSTLNSLRNHERKHLGLNSFLCVSCGKGFVTKNALKCHEKIHQEVKEYVCNICTRGFSVMGNLKTHQKKHHQGHRFYCSQCPRAFLAKCSLQRHELVHTGVKEFSCENCNAAFYTNKELVKHKKYHQGVRSYHCNQCFKTFFEKHHLTVHMRCHTGERPYACKVPGCGKSFRESQKLSRHTKRHH